MAREELKIKKAEKAELLLPAGSIEKMKYAIVYGADAVYLGTADFSLRSPKSGNIINNENIHESVKIAHSMGAKAYITLNVFANNEIIKKLSPLMEALSEASPDGIIFADAGFYSTVKKYLPNVPMHISTQANILNYETVKFWQDLGAQRVILARELSLCEIEEIHQKVPDMELEVLVHGSMCVAYSGRCLLSDYMTDNKRKANQGACSQPCRWKYSLVESNRQGEEYEITEDKHGTYILNPKDLCLIEHIPDLINAGVSSFKVEGRTKSMYYAALVAKTYRHAINAYYNNQNIDYKELYAELSNAGNRGFTSGFLKEFPDSSHYDYTSSKSSVSSLFQGVAKEITPDGKILIRAKNQIKSGEIVDFITPSFAVSAQIVEMQNEFEEKIVVANTNDNVYIRLKELKVQDLNLLNLLIISEDLKWGIIRQKYPQTERDSKNEKEMTSDAVKNEAYIYS